MCQAITSQILTVNTAGWGAGKPGLASMRASHKDEDEEITGKTINVSIMALTIWNAVQKSGQTILVRQAAQAKQRSKQFETNFVYLATHLTAVRQLPEKFVLNMTHENSEDLDWCIVMCSLVKNAGTHAYHE
jgi:hypothetical protein